MSAVPSTSVDLEAWNDYTRRAQRLAERLWTPDFPASPQQRALGISHLARQLMCWTSWSVAHADPRRPMFQRQNDLITPWGGPNAENVYRHARVESGRRYRIRGKMNSCEEFMLTVRRGFMHEDQWGTVFQVSASTLGIGEGDDFELLVGGTAEGAIPLPAGAAMVTFREYYFDWRPLEPAVFTIECLDDDAVDPVPLVDAEAVAQQLDRAIDGAEHSIENWNRYMLERRAEGVDNTFAPPHKVSKGLEDARYGFCFWDLEPDQALVVESTVPDARYWSLQLYQLAWYDLVDLVDRQTSLNHRQTVIDADGKFRVVLSHADPGVANWLDVGGRKDGLLTFRWFWQKGNPEITTRVVALGEVDSVLPAGTPRVSATERVEQIRARRAHLAWRFRT
jgi:hypothetical protein